MSRMYLRGRLSAGSSVRKKSPSRQMGSHFSCSCAGVGSSSAVGSGIGILSVSGVFQAAEQLSTVEVGAPTRSRRHRSALAMRRRRTLSRTTKERHLDAWLTALLEEPRGARATGGTSSPSSGMFCETSLFVGLIVPGDTIVLLTATAGRGSPTGCAGGRRRRGIARGRDGRVRDRSVLRAAPPRQPAREADRRAARAARGALAGPAGRRRHPDQPFLPVMHALIPVTVGASDYPYRRFIAWTAPACVRGRDLRVRGPGGGSSYHALARTCTSRAGSCSAASSSSSSSRGSQAAPPPPRAPVITPDEREGPASRRDTGPSCSLRGSEAVLDSQSFAIVW